MTYQDDYKLPIEYLEQLSEQGTEYLPELIRILVNAAMQIERQKHLGAGWHPPEKRRGWHERTPERQGHANGYKSKTVQTWVGDITFDIPQVREGGFIQLNFWQELWFSPGAEGIISIILLLAIGYWLQRQLRLRR